MNDQRRETAARRNRLLAGLSASALARLIPDFHLRRLSIKDKLIERNEPIEEVVFPVSCVLSTVALGAEGEIIEVGTIGNEGMGGLQVFLRTGTSSALDTFAQIPGDALFMRSRDFLAHLESEKRLVQIMSHYVNAFLTQVAQGSGCNRMRGAEERCARWLLMTVDRVGALEFPLTQEFLAQMLGVRRATVSGVAGQLQDRGLIRYERGQIEVLDLEGLKERTCECYDVINSEYDRMMPAGTAWKSRVS